MRDYPLTRDRSISASGGRIICGPVGPLALNGSTLTVMVGTPSPSTFRSVAPPQGTNAVSALVGAMPVGSWAYALVATRPDGSVVTVATGTLTVH